MVESAIIVFYVGIMLFCTFGLSAIWYVKKIRQLNLLRDRLNHHLSLLKKFKRR